MKNIYIESRRWWIKHDVCMKCVQEKSLLIQHVIMQCILYCVRYVVCNWRQLLSVLLRIYINMTGVKIVQHFCLLIYVIYARKIVSEV